MATMNMLAKSLGGRSPAAIRSLKRRARMTPNQRTRERSSYAKRRRNDLIETLAPDLCCAECGAQFIDPQFLQVDHVNGRAWLLSDYTAHVRYARYWLEHNAGVPLRALCASCNSKDGAMRRYGYDRSKGR